MTVTNMDDSRALINVVKTYEYDFLSWNPKCDFINSWTDIY